MNLTTAFICTSCNHKTPKWQGKCPNCGQWNTLVETKVQKRGGSQRSAADIVNLKGLEDSGAFRKSSSSSELDEVLGGGFVKGSLVLLGGDPGIGKSTLALQIALSMEQNGNNVLYVSGEESANQLRLRAKRLSTQVELNVISEADSELIFDTLESLKPDFVVIDSIQTLRSENVNGVVGGVAQITYATNQLLGICKKAHITVLIIGHVTKEGFLAGPKTLEHMVDVVMYMEGERFGSMRLLRCNKNRFGSAGEVGVFEMTEKGLIDVPNPSSLFLEHRDKPLPGSCVTAIMEGNKVLLLEIQALVSPSNFGYPKRATSGFDMNRLQLIVAILQKNLKLKLDNQDIYVNVAGGFKIDERAADLPVALAILSSYKNISLPAQSLAFGELGLLGELRGVGNSDKRLKEATKLGFNKIYCSLFSGQIKNKADKALVVVKNLSEVLPLFK